MGRGANQQTASGSVTRSAQDPLLEKVTQQARQQQREPASICLAQAPSISKRANPDPNADEMTMFMTYMDGSTNVATIGIQARFEDGVASFLAHTSIHYGADEAEYARGIRGKSQGSLQYQGDSLEQAVEAANIRMEELTASGYSGDPLDPSNPPCSFRFDVASCRAGN